MILTRYAFKMSSDKQPTKFQFVSPSNVIITGASQTGKTHFIIKVIKNADQLFTNPPVKIVYCYNIYQKSFDQINKYVEFHRGLPNINEIASVKGEHVVVIIDDLMQEIGSKMANLFTVETHHLNITCFFVLQNMFYQNKYLRTMTLNAHFLVLKRQSRDCTQISILARPIFGSKAKEFLRIYDEIMEKPYSYLIINIHPSNKFRVSVHLDIFPDEYEVTYV